MPHTLGIASFAVSDTNSLGRRVTEPEPAWRTEFQRDRDRIVHSSAFRRLEYKTQVFVNHEGDMFRTRLTHSLEVAQIARTVARALGVNEDLTEAIALAHDLGHTPFGHAGQSALNHCMKDAGGFEHNQQSLRVIDSLERRYEQFDGLNLLFETREGILKYCSQAQALTLGDVAARFMQGRQATLEAQIANLADEIAYNHHDVDDGIRSGILSPVLLREHEVFSGLAETTRWPGDHVPDRREMHSAIRAALGEFVDDLIVTTQQRIADRGVDSLEAIRAQTEPLAGFSETVAKRHLRLKRFLHRELYNHEIVHRFSRAAKATVTDLFDYYMNDPGRLPAEHQEKNGASVARRVADYIAGMTDRFAIAEHRRLSGENHWPERRS